VHIAHGAEVTVSGFTFSTPGDVSGSPCFVNNGLLCGTIGVDDSANLNLLSSVVEYSHLGNGLFVGNFNPLTIAHATIRFVDFVIPPGVSRNVAYVGIYVADGILQLSHSRVVSQPTLHGDSGGIFLDTGATALILHNTIVGGVPIQVCYSGGACNGINVRADISYNTIEPTGLSAFGKCGCASQAIVIGYSAKVEVTHNTIIGGPNVLNAIQVFTSDNAADPTVADMAHNTISNFLCTNLVGRPEGFCGPDFFTQNGMDGIGVFSELFATRVGVYPSTTSNAISITDNHISGTDVGVLLQGVENCCTVSHNSILQSTYYGIAAVDGNYTFSNNIITGGKYGVSAIAGLGTLFGEGSSNTTITLENTVIHGTSIAPTYIQTISPFTAKVLFKK
jgi:hypothetical protein